MAKVILMRLHVMKYMTFTLQIIPAQKNLIYYKMTILLKRAIVLLIQE